MATFLDLLSIHGAFEDGAQLKFGFDVWLYDGGMWSRNVNDDVYGKLILPTYICSDGWTFVNTDEEIGGGKAMEYLTEGSKVDRVLPDGRIKRFYMCTEFLTVYYELIEKDSVCSRSIYACDRDEFKNVDHKYRLVKED